MKNTICFFCDISGTLNGTEKNKEVDYQNLNKNLQLLMNKFNADCLLFSLVSSDNYHSVNDTMKKIRESLDSPILLRKQFFDKGYILDNEPYYHSSCKTDQIMGFLAEAEKDFNIKSIIYADDCTIFHDILTILAEEKYHITSIIPQNNEGLCELNKLLETFIQQKGKTLSMGINPLQHK